MCFDFCIRNKLHTFCRNTKYLVLSVLTVLALSMFSLLLKLTYVVLTFCYRSALFFLITVSRKDQKE